MKKYFKIILILVVIIILMAASSKLKWADFEPAVTTTLAEVNKLHGLTASTAELNLNDGLLRSATEGNTLVGIDTTKTLQGQIDSKVNTADSISLSVLVLKSDSISMPSVFYTKTEIDASFPTLTGASTLTNKRITKRCPVITQSATPAINTNITDVAHIVGLAQDITSMTTNLSGTPVEGDELRIDITDNGTARAITWGAKFEASTVALPTTTVISTRLDCLFYWNSVTSKWRIVRVS